jgi:hypothetical protein
VMKDVDVMTVDGRYSYDSYDASCYYYYGDCHGIIYYSVQPYYSTVIGVLPQMMMLSMSMQQQTMDWMAMWTTMRTRMM